MNCVRIEKITKKNLVPSPRSKDLLDFSDSFVVNSVGNLLQALESHLLGNSKNRRQWSKKRKRGRPNTDSRLHFFISLTLKSIQEIFCKNSFFLHSIKVQYNGFITMDNDAAKPGPSFCQTSPDIPVNLAAIYWQQYDKGK